MRSIFVLLILVMIGLNGKGQSVTALPDSVLSQCCLEVTLLNGNVTTVDWVFIQYITRDGTGTKLFVEYAPNFGGIQWETQIRIQDDFDDVTERSKFIMLPFTVGTTDYAINRNWIANIEENTTTGGTWIYGRFGTPTKRKFSAVEDYETMKNLLLACRPRAIVVAENGLYTEGDTVRMGGFLIENTTITTEGYNWQMKDTLSSVEFGLDYLTPETGDTTVYWGRRHGSIRQMVQLGRRYYYNSMRDTTGGLYSDLTHSWNAGDPFLQYQVFNPLAPTTGTAWFKVQKDNSFLNLSNDATNPYYSLGWAVTNSTATLGASESGSGDPGNGVVMGAYGFGTTEYLFMKTKAVDAGTATAGQYLQLINASSGEVDFATIDLSAYLSISDTAAMLSAYIRSAGWGLLKTSHTLTVDSFKVASRYYVGTNPTTIASGYLATSNGTSLVARNLFDNNTAVSILNSKPIIFGSQSVAGLPTGVDGYWLDVSNYKWPARYNSTAGAWIYPVQSALTGGLGTAGRVLYTDANGRATDSGNLTYTGTRFQTGGSIRLGYNNTSGDTVSIEKIVDVNSKTLIFKNPGSSGGYAANFVFRGGFNGTLSTANTFRIYTNSSTLPGSVYVGNVSEAGANSGNSTTNLGVLNKITSTTNYDTGINLHPLGSPENFSNYRFTTGKQFGIFIGGQSGNNNFASMSDASTFGVFAGFQWQPLAGGFASSWIFSAKNDASTATEVLRLQGKDGNICLGCTNAQYKLYTTSTDAYGLPRGTGGQRPTIITSTTPFRYNTDSTALEYGESVGTWRQLATRNYARSLVAGLGTGTVTSVGISLPSIFSVSGSPVTTSGTISASFTGGTSDLFLRGDGRWMKSLYFNVSDSIQFNITDPYLGSTALISMKGTSGSFDSRFNIADYGYVNHSLGISSEDDIRYNFDRSRGTIASPAALLKNDRIGGIYFNAHNGSSYRKTGYMGAVVDSIYSGANPQSKLIFGTASNNSPETSSAWRFLIESFRNISVVNHVTGANMGVGFGSNVATLETATIDARFHVKGAGTTTGKTMLIEDSGSADILTVTDNKLIQFNAYGTAATTATALSKTESNYNATFATDGTIVGREQKRDTTVYLVDTDLDWSSAITTTQISRRYNRVIFLMTTTAAAGSNSDLTLHTPDVNLMQVEYLIRSTDETGGFTNTIQFGSNNAVASDNALSGSYTPSAGQGVGIRAGLRSGVYKYYYY